MEDNNKEFGRHDPVNLDLSIDEILAEYQSVSLQPDSNSSDFSTAEESTALYSDTAAEQHFNDDLPDLPTRYDEDSPAFPDEPAADDDPTFDEEDPESAVESSAEADALPSLSDKELDDYLSFSDYEQQENAPESTEPERRRERPVQSRKGGLFGFLKNLGAPAERDSASDDGAFPAETENEAFLTEASGDYAAYPDGEPGDPDDGNPEFPDEPDTDYDAPVVISELYPVHGGSLGKAEQDARSYIAALQAESGMTGRRERADNSLYQVNLDDLLSMKGDDASAPAPTQKGVRAGSSRKAETAFAPESEEAEAAEEDGIDKRFNLGGHSTGNRISYGDNEVDLSADEEYVPVQAPEYNLSQWTPDYDDPLAERADSEEPPRKKHKFLFGKRRKEIAAEAARDEKREDARRTDAVELDDSAAEPAVYAANADYTDAPDYLAAPDSIDSSDYEDDEFDEYESLGDGKKYKESEMYVPPTFREYVLSLLASVWLRIRGTVRGRTSETMCDTEEDLGPELSPAEASKYYGSFLRSLKLRARISGVVLAVLVYISLEMPLPGMMKTLPVDAAFCFGLQAAIMLLALDVVTNGITNAFRLRFGADSLAVVSCLFTGIDALIVALSDTAAEHMPLCAVSSASIVGLLLAACLSARGLRKATRVPAIGKHFFAVTGETKLEPGEITLLKSVRSVKGFVRRTEEAGPDETLYTKISPLLFALALLLSVIVMIAKKSYPEFIYILSAMLVLTVPFGALLSFSLPFFLGSSRIFRFGAAIAGWSGLCDIGVSKNLIVTDRDLFPESAVSIDSVRIFADEDAQKVISYAGSMMSASGCCSAGCFEELMRETDSPMRQIDGFEIMPGGGMKGVIDGHVVLCGSTDLMRLMNVRIPFRLTDKTTVLLSIDGILYGIFALRYEGLPQIRKSLSDLVRTARPPVFAVRDFNVNPEMLHNTFDLATDGYDFPPYVERFRLSEPANDENVERIAAILCNEGLPPLTSVADLGRSMYLSTKINLWLNLIASVAGVLFVFFRFLITGSNSFATLFLFMLLCTIPVLLVSFFVNLRR